MKSVSASVILASAILLVGGSIIHRSDTKLFLQCVGCGVGIPGMYGWLATLKRSTQVGAVALCSRRTSLSLETQKLCLRMSNSTLSLIRFVPTFLRQTDDVAGFRFPGKNRVAKDGHYKR